MSNNNYQKPYIIIESQNEASLEQSINNLSEKGYVLHKIISKRYSTLEGLYHNVNVTRYTWVAIMVKKECTKEYKLLQAINSLKDAISYLPTIGVEYNKCLQSFEECKDAITE